MGINDLKQIQSSLYGDKGSDFQDDVIIKLTDMKNIDHDLYVLLINLHTLHSQEVKNGKHNLSKNLNGVITSIIELDANYRSELASLDKRLAIAETQAQSATKLHKFGAPAMIIFVLILFVFSLFSINPTAAEKTMSSTTNLLESGAKIIK